MATIAEFALPPEAFPLGVVFEAFPDAAIQLERVVPIGEAVRPYFWIENVASRSVCEFFDRNSAIEDATLIDPLGDRSLFRYRSRLGENGVLSALVESDLTLLSAAGTADGWTVHVRGDEQRAVGAFDERCRAAGIPPTLRELQATPAPAAEHRPPVTDAQHEALLLAYERGYYAEPRATTLAELAAEVGISRQAFARRLQRGYRSLIHFHFQLTATYEGVS